MSKKMNLLKTIDSLKEGFERETLAADENQDLTCMVRQLPATASGLPLELYFFSNDKIS